MIFRKVISEEFIGRHINGESRLEAMKVKVYGRKICMTTFPRLTPSRTKSEATYCEIVNAKCRRHVFISQHINLLHIESNTSHSK